VQFDYLDLFSAGSYSFLENKTKYIGSFIVYLLLLPPSILTSTAFALGSHGAQLMTSYLLQKTYVSCKQKEELFSALLAWKTLLQKDFHTFIMKAE